MNGIFSFNGEMDMADEADKKQNDASTGSKLSDLQNGLTKYIPIPVLTLYTGIDALLRTQTVTTGLLFVWWGTFVFFLFGSCAFAYKFTEGTPIKLIKFMDLTKTKKTDSSNNSMEQYFKTFEENWKANIGSHKTQISIVAFCAFLAYVMAIGGPFITLSTLVPGFVWEGYYGAAALAMVSLIILFILDKKEI